MHYLDDFLTMRASGVEESLMNLRKLCSVHGMLGLPLAEEKVEGPPVVFLGIQLDSMKMEIRLPPGKLIQLKGLVEEWLTRKKVIKHQLLSLIGHLAQAAKVVIPGRTFVRRMLDVANSKKELYHWLYL